MNYVGIDLDQKYVDISNARIAAYTSMDDVEKEAIQVIEEKEDHFSSLFGV